MYYCTSSQKLWAKLHEPLAKRQCLGHGPPSSGDRELHDDNTVLGETCLLGWHRYFTGPWQQKMAVYTFKPHTGTSYYLVVLDDCLWILSELTMIYGGSSKQNHFNTFQKSIYFGFSWIRYDLLWSPIWLLKVGTFFLFPRPCRPVPMGCRATTRQHHLHLEIQKPAVRSDFVSTRLGRSPKIGISSSVLVAPVFGDFRMDRIAVLLRGHQPTFDDES